jgi:hypothetical protein
MPLRAPAVYPGDIRSFDQWTRDVPVLPDPDSVGTVELINGQVTDEKLRGSSPTSVIGRLQGTSGTPGDITATSDNTLLVRRGGVLEFTTLADGDIPDTIARNDAVDTSISGAITALKAEPDPFPVYLNQTEGDARYVQVANVLNGSKTYDPPSIATGAQATTTVTVTGAVLGDYARASFSLDIAAMVVSSHVSAADTVTVVLLNMTGGTIDLASGTLKARVWKQ